MWFLACTFMKSSWIVADMKFQMEWNGDI